MEVAIATCGPILANQISVLSVDLIRYPNMVWHVSLSVVFAELFCNSYWHGVVHISD